MATRLMCEAQPPRSETYQRVQRRAMSRASRACAPLMGSSSISTKMFSISQIKMKLLPWWLHQSLKGGRAHNALLPIERKKTLARRTLRWRVQQRSGKMKLLKGNKPLQRCKVLSALQTSPCRGVPVAQTNAYLATAAIFRIRRYHLLQSSKSSRVVRQKLAL